nr:SAM-dependent chlorinase/fluorinase [Candidatus Sigynarchaeota archaeon]
MKACIGLLTDFGTKAGYVASMKGAILSIYDGCSIIDLSHDISPQNILEAAYFLDNCASYFPNNFIFLVVVDPGVGTSRRMICIKTKKKKQYFIAPDNGVLQLVINAEDAETIVALENPAYWNRAPSRTFHGRDIMGPVAAHVAKGTDITRLGPALAPDAIARIELPPPAKTMEDGTIIGSVIYADRFGNIITNIEEDNFNPVPTSGKTVLLVKVNFGTTRECSKEIYFNHVYADVPEKDALCLFNSERKFEIAINKGSATSIFGNPAPRS